MASTPSTSRSTAVNIQAGNVSLTVEEEPKVEKLRRHNEKQPNSKFLPYAKCAAAGFLSLLFLACGVFSKLSVISVAKSNANDGKESCRRYIMLVIILMVPQLVSFVWAFWGSLRKKNNPWPTCMSIFFCVLASVAEVVGLSFFVMLVLPMKEVSGVDSIAIMNCVGMLSIFRQIFKSYHREEQNTAARKLLSFICALTQLAGFVVIIVLNKNPKKLGYFLPPLLLVSFAWVPTIRKLQCIPQSDPLDAVDQNHLGIEEVSNGDPSNHPGEYLRIRTARRKATLICEGLKLLLTPFVTYFMYKYMNDSGKKNMADLDVGFEYLSQKTDIVFKYFLVNIFSSFVGYVVGMISCSMAMQKFCFALPITLMTPVSFFIAVGSERLFGYKWLFDHNLFVNHKQMWIAIIVFACVFLAQLLSTIYYIWHSQDLIMATERQLFWMPSYNGVMLEQNLLLNRKNELTEDYVLDRNKLAKDSCVFICTTMYHEADYEMEQLLHSIRRVDVARERSKRRIESHIWFDGAVKGDVLNSYVLQLISLVKKTLHVEVDACTRLETPYGMEMRWKLPGGMNFHIHLKDNLKVKNKKRWSQIMYMSYVLDFKIKQMNVPEADTYILTTDADIKFDADSVEALLDRLIRDPKVGAVCGRTHPIGHGPLVWYQKFDYAIGHWLQKVANHVLGSVLCCPGCFSVYRAKAVRDVLSIYSTTADHAVDFLTKDMGEDRWLCTLMVQAGWRLEYCAAAENSTHCPDAFDEFYKQRRRWIPSTLANLALVISESQITLKNNDSMSYPFILYQMANVFSTLISPGTVILIMLGGLVYGWQNINELAVLILLTLVAFGYGLMCLYTSQDLQLKTAKVLTVVYSLLMSVVFVGVLVQSVENPVKKTDVTPTPTSITLPPKSTIPPTTSTKNSKASFNVPVWISKGPHALENTFSNFLLEGKTSPKSATTSQNPSTPSPTPKEPLYQRFAISAWYLFAIVAVFVLTAFCHPTEAGCLVHGIWYLLCLPSGYLFLIIYSICNLTDRSWGTREAKTKSANDKPISKIIMDKLIWVCHGCKDDPVQEPVSEPVEPVDRTRSTTSDSSSESDSQSDQTLQESNMEESDDNSENVDENYTKTAKTEENLPTPHSPTSPTRPLKPALKKGPRSPSHDSNIEFRLPGHPKRSVHFHHKLPQFKSHTSVEDWLDGKMKKYKPNFEQNGYDDTSFICGMTDQDLIDIGIETRGHRKKLLREIEQIPLVDMGNNVPDNVDKWLADLGLHDYWLNFKNNSYDNPKALEDLKVMNSKDLSKVLTDDLHVTKKGHLKKLTTAVRKLQYPSAIERKIREARQALRKVPTWLLREENEGEEFEFWSKLRKLRLLPESKAFGQHSELADKLEDLRSSVVLAFTVANMVWIILIYVLARHASLKVQSTNFLSLAFLVAFGAIVVIQFFTMLWHRVDTLLHILARAPFRGDSPSFKGWAFSDESLIPPPTEEELQQVRRRSQRALSRDFTSSDEHQPLLGTNGRPSYRFSRPFSPRPV
ncbi:uncharacterized protein LOC124450504 isoform X2 [Xenia sp. Carnegie-2017]|uniref:uncharacterized protein LOC124450504 isoform X2 n=1 Tax=Xenia sp. Carnegie-2017 TaxID=2897299 RepID=UPI001F03DB2D|nr:uncharacterized protein LOC124450504 isoform X2 [Xenia sp. Carnegie-2017]